MPSLGYRLKDFLERLRHLPGTPLASLRRSVWWIRKTFFTRPRPGNPGYVVPLTEDDVKRLLGRHYFDPGWEFSYSYRHEVVNLRRVEFYDHPDYLECEWWQVHIRGYDHPRGSNAPRTSRPNRPRARTPTSRSSASNWTAGRTRSGRCSRTRVSTTTCGRPSPGLSGAQPSLREFVTASPGRRYRLLTETVCRM